MAILYKFTGEQIDIEPKNGQDFQLEELYRLLEFKTIRILDILQDDILVIDEEGTIKKNHIARYNREASNLLGGYALYGNVLRCKKEQIQ